MLLPLAYYGSPSLRKKCAPVQTIDEELKQFVSDLAETMLAHRGIGLAASQVHRLINLFITKVPFELADGTEHDGILRVFINPKILSVSSEVHYRGEGCLSIPKIYGEVERPLRIEVEFLNLEGEKKNETFHGLEARCILHENDHINGVLFIDRMNGRERQLLEPLLKQMKKKYHPKE